MIASPDKFIISPKNGSQYNNVKKIGDSDIIINTSIEEAIDVQRHGVVKSLPINYKGDIKVGYEVIVHHNIFRITYNDKGVPMQSDSHIIDDLFFADQELVYLSICQEQKKGANGYVFIKPIEEEVEFEGKKELQHIGIIRYICRELESQGLKEGDKICFRKNCEYEFKVDEERLYVMNHKRILAKLN